MTQEKYNCQISIKGLALTGAILWGGYLFILALLAGFGFRFMWISPEWVNILAAVYPGYVVGLGGALLGLLYGLVCGAICGGLTAWLHNKLGNGLLSA